jgi:hypothetical protein
MRKHFYENSRHGNSTGQIPKQILFAKAVSLVETMSPTAVANLNIYGDLLLLLPLEGMLV